MKWLSAVALALPLAVMAQAPAPAKNSAPAPKSKEAEHRKEDIARHRQMAQAHEEAARCLEGGASEKQCQERLREMCKGIAVGQYCGMRHGH
jgi:thiamine pyrophosphate-dependent acetolactate synthase large subunit-like protein